MLKIQWEEQQQSLKGNTKKFVIAIKKKKKRPFKFWGQIVRKESLEK